MIATELDISASLQSGLNGFTEPVAIFAARWLIVFVFFLAAGATWVERHPSTRHAWKEVWWSIVLALVVSLALAEVIGRSRPFHDSSGLVRALIPNPASEYAFPSSHSATIWAWAFGVRQIHPSFSWLWVLIAVLVALGRVFVGVHYVSDVAAGAVIGIGAFFLVRFGHRRTRRVIAS